MDVVRAAARGDISREELVRILLSWSYEPHYWTTGLSDDWEFRENSFEAVQYAFMRDIIDERDYERIIRILDGEEPKTERAAGQDSPPD